MTPTGDQPAPGTGQGAPAGATPAGDPGAAGSGALPVSNEVLEAIRISQRETQQAVQRDFNTLKAAYDRGFSQLRQTLEERLSAAAPSRDRDVEAMLNSPHVDEAEKQRLRAELSQRELESERRARQQAEQSATYQRELLEATITVNNTFAAWGMTGQEEGIYQPQAGESPRDAASRIIASIPHAKLNAQRQMVTQAASRELHAVAQPAGAALAPRLDTSAPSGPVPVNESLTAFAEMGPAQRETVMKRIRKAGSAGQPIGIQEAVRGS